MKFGVFLTFLLSVLSVTHGASIKTNENVVAASKTKAEKAALLETKLVDKFEKELEQVLKDDVVIEGKSAEVGKKKAFDETLAKEVVAELEKLQENALKGVLLNDPAAKKNEVKKTEDKNVALEGNAAKQSGQKQDKKVVLQGKSARSSGTTTFVKKEDVVLEGKSAKASEQGRSLVLDVKSARTVGQKQGKSTKKLEHKQNKNLVLEGKSAKTSDQKQGKGLVLQGKSARSPAAKEKKLRSKAIGKAIGELEANEPALKKLEQELVDKITEQIERDQKAKRAAAAKRKSMRKRAPRGRQVKHAIQISRRLAGGQRRNRYLASNYNTQGRYLSSGGMIDLNRRGFAPRQQNRYYAPNHGGDRYLATELQSSYLAPANILSGRDSGLAPGYRYVSSRVLSGRNSYPAPVNSRFLSGLNSYSGPVNSQGVNGYSGVREYGRKYAALW